MAVKGINCVSVHVSDLQRSKRFYADILGWELQTDEHGVAGFSFGNSYLVVHADDRTKGDRSYAGGMHLLVDVDDVDVEHARLKTLGVTVGNLRDQPWGYRTFTIADPDGYTWEYGQDKAGHD